MGAWLRARSLAPGNHLPPAEISPLLYVNHKGKIRSIHKLETPVDEFGVPDVEQIVRQLTDTIKVPYQWPAETNVHHAAWPRRQYDDELEREYRNGSSLLMHISVQFHNWAHESMQPPDKPPRDVMHQRVIEQRYIDNVFQCGRLAVRYARWSENIENLVVSNVDAAWLEDAREFYDRKAKHETSNYENLLEKMPPPQVGLLPEANELAKMGILAATRHLGRFAAAQAVDYRRFVQEASLKAA